MKVSTKAKPIFDSARGGGIGGTVERIVVALAGWSAAECRWVGCEAEEGGSR
jgi:hypothetical protein